MIEPSMYFGLGFLVASLLALIFLPLVHSRAVRLTRRRVEASVPHSVAEVQADKDQMRAEFAIAMRRLEAHVSQLKEKTTEQLAELGKKTVAANRLKQDIEAKTAQISTAVTREEELREKLKETEDALAVKTSNLADIEHKLGERETALGNLGREFAGKSMAADSQQIEIVALRTKIATLQNQLLEAQDRALSKEQQTGREQAQVATSAVALAEVTRERERLRAEADAAKRIEKDLREELTTIDRRYRAAAEQLRTEKATLEGQLERAREERARLQREIASVKQDPRDNDRAENTLIRERISNVAAELAHLTAKIEGPESPINALVAEAPQSAGAAVTLADRIRALQAKAAQAHAQP